MAPSGDSAETADEVLTVQSGSLVTDINVLGELPPTFVSCLFPELHPDMLQLLRVPVLRHDRHELCKLYQNLNFARRKIHFRCNILSGNECLSIEVFTFSPKGIVRLLQQGSALWGNTLAIALLQDPNWTIPFRLIVLRVARLHVPPIVSWRRANRGTRQFNLLQLKVFGVKFTFKRNSTDFFR